MHTEVQHHFSVELCIAFLCTVDGWRASSKEILLCPAVSLIIHVNICLATQKAIYLCVGMYTQCKDRNTSYAGGGC